MRITVLCALGALVLACPSRAVAEPLSLSNTARVVARGRQSALFEDRGRVLRLSSDLSSEDLGQTGRISRSLGIFGYRRQTDPMGESATEVVGDGGRLCRVPDYPRCDRGFSGHHLTRSSAGVIGLLEGMVRAAGVEPAWAMPDGFSYHFGFRRRPRTFVVWTIPSS